MGGLSKIAVFASGNGSNFQALVDDARIAEAVYEIALLVCDRPAAYVCTRARAHDIPIVSFVPKDYHDKAEYEAFVLEQLQAHHIEWIVLAGYMRLIGPTLLHAYEGRIINIHPSLLPSFPGKDGIGDAVRHGVKVTGVTVHIVDAGLDTGPILAQQAVTIADGDTLADVEDKIHAVEHILLPKVVRQLVRK